MDNRSQTIPSEESLRWCSTCQRTLPPHTCEWKVLVATVLGAGVLSVVGVMVTLYTQ